MCARLTPPKWTMVVGSCGNTTDRGKRLEKGFGSGTGGSTGVQKKKSLGKVPATELCGATQVKAKTKTSSSHFPDGIAPTF